MYKLVAIDLDGTLLNSQKRISDENRETIRRAIDKGVKIVICSGRIFTGAKVFARQICTREPLIACNGAIIKDMETEEVLYNNFLGREDCFKIIDICQKENVYFHAYIGDTMFAEKLEYSALFYWKKNRELPVNERVDVRLVKNLNEILRQSKVQPTKIVVISEDPDVLARTRKQVEEIKTVEVMSSDSNNFEIVNYGVNKGNALKFISERMNINREEIIAIGDNENDYSMLQYAGLAVAMGNAGSMVKEIADYIALANDENGVSDALKKFVL